MPTAPPAERHAPKRTRERRQAGSSNCIEAFLTAGSKWAHVSFPPRSTDDAASLLTEFFLVCAEVASETSATIRSLLEVRGWRAPPDQRLEHKRRLYDRPGTVRKARPSGESRRRSCPSRPPVAWPDSSSRGEPSDSTEAARFGRGSKNRRY